MATTPAKRLKDVPALARDASNLAPVMEAVREALQTFRGYRGDRLDAALTLRDFSRATQLGVLGGGLLGVGVTGGTAPAPTAGEPARDLTPPPTPTGLACDAAISNIFIECDAALYTQGRGHDKTVVYGAKWPSAELVAPTFSNAVVLCEFQGTVTAYASDPATRWCIWIKWQSNDGVLSVDPAGGTNGVTVTTGQDVALLLEALTGEIRASELHTTLGTRIDLIDAASGVAGSVNARILTEANDRATAITGEVTARNAAILVETNNRITAVSDEATARATAVAAETTARAAAITTEVNDRNAAILVETNNRIDAVASEATARVNAINAESRQRGDQAQATAEALLRNVLSVNEARVQGVENVAAAKSELTSDMQAGVAAEAALRIALDTKLTTEKAVTLALITDESVARSTADAAEAAQRVTLEAKVDTNQTAALAAVSSEASARATAVSSEATQRDALATQFRGSYTGNDLAALTTGLLYQERTTRTTEDLALAQQITLLSAGAGEQFDWQTIWYFDAGVESWTGNGTPTTTSGWLRPADQASGAYVNSPAGMAADGAKYGQVRLRIRKTGSPTFAGWLYWQGTLDSTWDNARRVALTEPTYDSNGIGLITANPAWGSITVNKVRIDLSSAQAGGSCFEIDWVAVGRPSPGASSAQLYTEQVARAAADTAMAADITTLTSQVNNGTNGLAATYAGLVTEQSTRAAADTANASSISTLSAQVNHVTTGLPATLALLATEQTTRADADTAEAAARVTLAARVTTAEGNITSTASTLTTEQTTRASADTTNANAITALSSQVNDVSTGLPQTRADLITTQNTLATSTAASAADIRSLRVQSQAIDATVLRNVLTGHATRAEFTGTLALATQELHAEMVIGLSAEAVARTALAAVVSTNESAAAASVLDEQTARVAADSAEAAARLDLAATVTTNAGTAAAAVLAEQTARADADTAEAAARLALAATVTTNAGTAAAAVLSEESARVAADSAEAAARVALAATVTTNAGIAAAALAAEQTVRADADTAEAAARVTLAARVTTAEGNITTTASNLTTEQTTRATADTTNANAITALSSQVNDVSTGLPQTRADLITVQSTLATATAASASDIRSLRVQSQRIDETTLRNVLTGHATREEFIGTLAIATQELHTEMVNGLSAEATARLALAAVVATNESTNAASLSDEQTARADADSAEAASRLALAATVTTNAGIAAAALSDEQTTRATADTAEANARLALAATVTDNHATLTTDYYTGATTDAAIASAATTLRAYADAGDAVVDARVTTVETSKIGYCTLSGAATDHTTRTTCEAAGGTWNVGLPLAQAVKQVSVSDGTTTAALEQRFTAQKTLDDIFKLQYSVKLDVGGKVAGFGLYNATGTPSVFAIRADRFYVSPPASGAGDATDDIIPFTVQATATTINGVAVPAGVYITDAYIKNGTITNAKIGNAQIDDAKVANMSVAKLTAGSMQVGAYIRSTSYTSGSAGFTIGADGFAEFNNVVVRGTVYATAGELQGIVIKDNSGNVIMSSGAATFSGEVTGDVTGTIDGTTASTLVYNAATALSTANTAVDDAYDAMQAANEANTALANIASDSILSPSEKPSVVQNYTVIIDEQSGIDAQATSFGITTTKTAYDTAVSALTTYLGTLTGWNTVPGSNVTIVGTTFRGKFADVYTTKQALLDAIAAKAKVLADAAQGQANTATSNASTAQGTANTAVTNAATAQGTANTAVTNAATAQSTANTALANAATANSGLTTKLFNNAQNALSGYGGIGTGTLSWNSSGVRTGGYGVGFTQNGIAAYNSAGDVTFALNGATGDASFKGSISASSFNVGEFTAYAWPAAGGTGVHISVNGIAAGNPTASGSNPGGKYFLLATPPGGAPAISTNIPAYIEDAQIATLKIGTEQVTIPRYYTAASYTASVSITVAAACDVLVIGTIQVPNSSYWQRLKQDGSDIQVEMCVGGSLPCFMKKVAISAGTTTFAISNDDTSSARAGIYVLATMR